MRPPGEWGGREATERTSIKGLRLPGEWSSIDIRYLKKKIVIVAWTA